MRLARSLKLPRLLKSRLWLIWLFVFLSSPAVAVDLSSNLYTTVRYSDNIRKTAIDEDSDTSQKLGLKIAVKEERRDFQSTADLRLEKDFYYENSLEGKTSVTTGFGLINFNLVDDFLNWDSSLTRTETLNDPFANELPENRGFRTVFKTGPVFNYKVNQSTNLNFSSRYVVNENSDSNVSDSKRSETSAGVSHSLNSLTTLNVNTTYKDIIDGDGLDEYENVNVNVGFMRKINQGRVSLNVGVTRLSPEDGEDTQSNSIKFNFTQSDVYMHTLGLSYVQDISDTAIGFDEDALRESESDETPILRGVSGNDIVERRRTNLSVSRDIEFFSYTLTGFWENEDYEVQSNDQRSVGGTLKFNQSVYSDFGMDYSYSFRQNHALENAFVGKEKLHTYRVGSRYEFSKDLFFSGGLQFTERENDSNDSRKYEDWSVDLSLNWTLL